VCHPVGPTCPECGSQILLGAVFCAECGARLGIETVPAQAFCPKCGAAVGQGDTFCVECGARLKAAAPQEQPVCPGCGEPIGPQAAFCGNCGRIVRQGAEYTPSASASAVAESRQLFQSQMQLQPQDQLQCQAYSPQQDWVQPQAQPQLHRREPVHNQQQSRVPQQPQKSNQHKMLMAAVAAVILLFIGIAGFYKPGFLRSSSAKLENGMLALNDIALDFKQTNLKNGAATIAIVKEKEEEVHNGLFGDLYVMNIDKNCQGKVTVSVPVPKGFKPTTGNGVYIKLGIGRDYPLTDGKTARFYEYFDATVKDGKAVATIDPAASGRSRHKSKTSAKQAVKTTDVGNFIEYVGFFYKEGLVYYGEGYQNSKGHFRLWYPYHIDLRKNAFMGSGEAQNLLSDLEEAYNYYKTHGYADHVDTFTPIDVYVSSSKDDGGWNFLSGNMELNERKMFGDNLKLGYEGERRKYTKTTIYHEVFHAVQQSIINMVASKVFETLWFDEATSTHFETLITPGITPNGGTYFSLLWQGLIPEHNTQQEGYARGLMIDYMSSKLGGDAWIRECYEKWSASCWKLKSFMRDIAGTEADFAADFYMEVVKNLGPNRAAAYYGSSQHSGNAYLSAIRLQLDDKTKEKIANGEEDAFPVVFTSPSFELGGYGGHIVALVTQERKDKSQVNLTENYPNKCQLKLETEGDCRIQVIKFMIGKDNVVSSNDKVIQNFKDQLKEGYLYLVLVTSTQSTKQNVVLKATLEKDQLKEGIYNGKATMTQGKKSQTINNRLGFRLSQEKDGRWALNVCYANGDYFGTAPNVPLVYDAKQKMWKGHRKFKEELSKGKAEVSTINCTMKDNPEGKEPVLIVDYTVVISRTWGYPKEEKFNLHFEGKWSSELKGKTMEMGKITILE
jgi:DNA-directed RNA polymerase subunit RPC12/RpoP